MRILLVNCPTSISDSKTAEKLPPIGLFYIKEYCVAHIPSISIEIFDPVLRGFGVEKTCEYIKKYNPSIIGINILSPLFSIARLIITNIKTKDNLVVVGGPHASLKPEESLLLSNSDISVINDGEVTFSEIITAYIHVRKYIDI